MQIKKIFLIVFLFSYLAANSQVASKVNFSKRKFQDKKLSWTPEQLNSANTFHKLSYMTLDEKMVLYYINLARIDSKLFVKTILKDYIDSVGTANPRLTSLKRDLGIQKSAKPLMPQKDLHQLAKSYAIHQAKTGQTGSNNFNDRTKKLCASERYLDVKELLFYSKNQALDVAIGILAGSSELGVVPLDISKKQRKVILSKKFNTIGLSIKTHSDYEYICVFEVGNRVFKEKALLTPKQKIKVAKKQKKLDFKNRKRKDRGKKPKLSKEEKKRKIGCDE